MKYRKENGVIRKQGRGRKDDGREADGQIG